jgi:hypothetical protein
MEKLYFIFETSQSLSNTGMGTVVGDWENESDDIHIARANWTAIRAVPVGCRYQLISQSQSPPDLDNYTWDYTNNDGIGAQNSFTQSWDEYVTQSLSL